jgi:hypothetical protein
MTYVFDTSSLLVLRNFYPERFPTFWQVFGELTMNGTVISVREVLRELEILLEEGHMRDWVRNRSDLFLQPSGPEMRFVETIFSKAHFRSLINRKAILAGRPVADPFVIASAKIREGTTVTQESLSPNAAKMPNVCEHYGIPCINLETFLEQQGCRF